ncbi:MAG: restriction endonuclease subunit S [Methylococcaceae bacterium]|nr:MAG: restriction endonuclease subunit S [Methylococcaceae bacterium]
MYRREWRETKLGNTGKIITGKTPPKDNPEDWGNEVLFITPSDYKNYGKKAYSSIRMLSKTGAKRQQNRMLPPNSILVTCIGSDMGKSVVNAVPCVFNQQINAIIPDSSVANGDYLYYLTLDFYETLRSLGSDGTAVPILNKSDFENIDILLPALPEQEAIAAVLSSLDDKIDLLIRQNLTLEAMAETLFRQWFVVDAREDWGDGKLGDEFDFTMGQSPSGNSFNDKGNGIPMFQGNADFGFRFPSERIFTTEPTRFARKFDTLISVRAPVGAQNMAHKECCIGCGVAAFRYKYNNGYYTYTYFKLRSLMEEIKQFNNEGTVFGSISKSDFENIVIIIPSNDAVINFENNVKPINDKIIKNCQQIKTLETIRDTLLPKLMSGEVRVNYKELL